jgi:hypothetical protein
MKINNDEKVEEGEKIDIVKSLDADGDNAQGGEQPKKKKKKKPKTDKKEEGDKKKDEDEEDEDLSKKENPWKTKIEFSKFTDVKKSKFQDNSSFRVLKNWEEKEDYRQT